jgi:hypothetical protein
MNDACATSTIVLHIELIGHSHTVPRCGETWRRRGLLINSHGFPFSLVEKKLTSLRKMKGLLVSRREDIF